MSYGGILNALNALHTGQTERLKDRRRGRGTLATGQAESPQRVKLVQPSLIDTLKGEVNAAR